MKKQESATFAKQSLDINTVGDTEVLHIAH